MPEITRRRLLGSAAAGAGGVLASSLLPPALARAAARGPQSRLAARCQARCHPHAGEPLVRSLLRDARGGARLRRPERRRSSPTGGRCSIRTTHTTQMVTCCRGTSIRPRQARRQSRRPHTPGPSSTSHWTSPFQRVRGSRPRRRTTTGSRATSSPTAPSRYWYVMGYYERQDIPFHFALAETFTLCDAYFCSLLWPDLAEPDVPDDRDDRPRGRTDGGPVISNVVPSPSSGTPYTWQTYPEALTKAGISVADLPGGR